MAELLISPWSDRFNELIENTNSSLVICAPYIGRGPCERLASALRRRRATRRIDLFVLTDLSRDNLLSGATDPAAIAGLVESVPRAIVRFLPSLHAKVYVADSHSAVVTSANFTDSGLYRNFEYGVIVRDGTAVARIRQDVLSYGDLGSPVSLDQLQVFAAAAQELRAYRDNAISRLRRELRVQFDQKLDSMDEAVLRTRAAERSLDAILSDAVVYLLRGRALTTREIHAGVQRIHPDLCDDTIDRIIDGRSFGKKWKHAVRRAQYHLKERGRIRLLGGRWILVE